MRQRGQSMVEFAASIAMLGLLLLGGISVIGLQQVQRRTVTAARESAFQQAWTAGRSDNQSLRARLAAAHFDDPGLTNATGSARMLQQQDIGLDAQHGQVAGRGGAAVQLLINPLRRVGGFLSGGFDLADDGFHSGTVTADVAGAAEMPDPFNSLSMRMSQPYALLGNDWSAASPEQVARRAGGLVPARRLTAVSSEWRALSAPLAVFEPSLRQLCLGLIEPDRVPEDRLGPGTSQEVACP